MRVAVTGAGGFVGRRLVEVLSRRAGTDVVALNRSAVGRPVPGAAYHRVGDMASGGDYAGLLEGVEVLVHCAARVHVMREGAADALALYRRVNVEGTLALARQAAASGVRRMVFLSSVKVNGESTVMGRPFTESNAPRPLDPYGVSKLEAEEALLALGRSSGMEVVVIRPPLVYGPGVKANFASMMAWLYRGVPLPLGSVRNLRSFVALDNLVDLIVLSAGHPAAAGEVFLVSDGEDLSTTDLLLRMGRALGSPARLVPVPVGMMRRVAGLFGRGDMADRLFGSLQVDGSKAREVLGWRPVVSVDEGLRLAAEGFLGSRVKE